MRWTFIFKQAIHYDCWLDGITPCRVIHHDHISPKYRLIELSNGDRGEVEFWRVKSHPAQKPQRPQTPSDVYCPRCGQLGRDPQQCEHCGVDIQ